MQMGRRENTVIAAVVGLLAAVVVLFGSCPAAAESRVYLGPHADYAIDVSGQWTIEEMAGPEGEARFERANGRRAANFGAANGPSAVMWLRFVVPANLATDGGGVVLTIRESRIRTLEAFRLAGRSFEVQSWRLGVMGEHARMATRYPTLELPESVRGETVYIRFHTPSSMRATVWAQTEASFLRTYSQEMMFFGILFGALAALLVYLSSAALASRDATMGALAVLVLGFIGHILGDRAFIDTYLLPGQIVISRTVSFGSTFVIYTVALFYALRTLRTHAQFPRLARALDICVALLGVLTIAAIVTIAADITFMRRISPLIALSMIGCVVLLTVAAAFKEPRRAILFLLCWWPALATGVARVMPDLLPQDGFDPVLIDLMYPAFVISLLFAGIVAASDIRDRERALTRAAEKNASRLKAFAESASDSFWEADADGRVLFASGPACLAAGLSEGVMVHSVLDSAIAGSLKPGKPLSRAPMIRQDADGGLRHLRVSAVPIPGGGWRGIASDVTEEVRETERMNQQRRMAALGQLAGGIAHEINNLLHPVINLSRMAGESLDMGDQRRRWLDIVQDSSARAAKLVSALLTSVRPVHGDGRTAALGAALTDIADEVRMLVPASTRLETLIDTKEGPVLPVAEVFQLVANLVNNAIYATNGGTVRLSYTASQTDGRNRFELSVDDDGLGMDDATLQRAAEPFFTTKPQGHGTGLGLSIVQALASKWGGELEIASQLGRGTQVRVTILSPMDAGHEGEGLHEDSRS